MRHSHNFGRHEAMSPYVLYIHTSAGDFTARNNQLWRSHLAIIIYKLCESYEDDDWLPWMLHWRSILALYSSSSWYILSLATCFPQDEEQTRANRRYIQGKFTCVVLSISASTLNHVSSTSFNTKYLNYLLFHETSDFSFTSKVDHHVMHILTPTMLYVRTQALNVVIYISTLVSICIITYLHYIYNLALIYIWFWLLYTYEYIICDNWLFIDY